MEGSHTRDGRGRAPRSHHPFDLIVVAASSGGFEALEAIFSRLPAEFPIPIAVVLHRTLQVPEILVDLLGERGPLSG